MNDPYESPIKVKSDDDIIHELIGDEWDNNPYGNNNQTRGQRWTKNNY